MKNPVILGIDPGTVLSGYGVIRRVSCGLEAIDYGCIRPPKTVEMAERCHYILNGLEELLQKYEPDFLVVETQFVAKKNMQSAIKLGMIRGIVLAVAKKFSVKEIIECPPALAKKAVTGRGQASKSQVQSMVQWLLNLVELPKPQDAADALALAIFLANKLRV